MVHTGPLIALTSTRAAIGPSTHSKVPNRMRHRRPAYLQHSRSAFTSQAYLGRARIEGPNQSWIFKLKSARCIADQTMGIGCHENAVPSLSLMATAASSLTNRKSEDFPASTQRRRIPMKEIKILLFMAILALALFPAAADAGRRGPVGTKSTTLGPHDGVQAEGGRTVKGSKAQSNFMLKGRGGRSVTGSASSTVSGGKGKGTATVSTSKGRSATMEGQGSVSAGKASGSGSVTTDKGRGVSGSGSVKKTETGISGTGTATTNSGKSASGTIDGNKESGTMSVTTDRGTKSKEYETGDARTAQKRSRLRGRRAPN